MELSDLDRIPHPATAVHDKSRFCSACNRELADDIFCQWHGVVDDQWLCDECVTAGRRISHGDVAQALYKKFMDSEAVRIQLGIVQGAIENLAEIKWIQGNDAAGSHRSVDLNLTFRESRPIYRALYEVLRRKLENSVSFPA